VSVIVDLNPVPTHLQVTLTGEYTLEGFKSALVRIRQSADDYQSQKILIDCRGLAGNPSLRERFEVVAFVLQQRITAILHGKPSKVATAIVATPPLLHPGRYGIRLLIERNMNLTVCAEIEEALTWLGVETQARQPDSNPASG